jgi:pimeloyl-ACP methyl ester carboxylesterase
MMVDRRTVWRTDRPSLATAWAERGMRVLVPDLRGHGESGPNASTGGSWSYEQMIEDVSHYLALAAGIAPGLPLVLAGNSLFGHLALAYLGMHQDTRVDAMVGFAVNIWNQRWNASAARGIAKQALVAVSRVVVDRVGYLPARRAGLGTEDESHAYWSCMLRWVPGNRWDSLAGIDYAAGLARVSCPFLHVVSDGDRLLCHPDDALLFSGALPNREVLRLGPGTFEESAGLRELAFRPPGHVEMVAHPRCLPLWRHTADWALSKISDRGCTRRR